MTRNSIASLRCAHVGKILSNFAILGTVLCLASVAYYLFLAVYYLILVIVLFITLFTVLYYYPEFTKLFDTEAMQTVVNLFNTYMPYIAPVTIAVSALSVTMLAISKQKSAIPRLVLAAISLAVSLIMTVIVYTGGGAQ